MDHFSQRTQLKFHTLSVRYCEEVEPKIHMSQRYLGVIPPPAFKIIRNKMKSLRIVMGQMKRGSFAMTFLGATQENVTCNVNNKLFEVPFVKLL